MRRIFRAFVWLAVALLLPGCTDEQGPDTSLERTATSADRLHFIGESSIGLPDGWSYNFSRQGPESWHFSLSPEPFNLGNRCDRNGPLTKELLERAGVFVTGFAYPSRFPGAAGDYEQTPGTFTLDEKTLANYEGFCHPTYRIDFSLEGLYVSMHVAVSDEAEEGTIDEALDVLNSIR